VSPGASWQFSSRRLFGDALLIARGTVIGQAPFVLATPLITRLFSATELGIYGVAFAFVGIAAPVAGLRLELAAISTRNDAEARVLLVASALACIPVTLASTLLLCVLKSFGIGSYGALSWALAALTALTIAGAGLYSSLRCWLVRGGRFALVAKSLAIQGGLRAGLPVAGAAFYAAAPLLMLAELVSRFSVIWLMARGAGLVPALRRTHISAGVLRHCVRRFWKYPLLMGPSALIDAAAVALPVPILATLFGLAAAGKFALVQRLVLLPATLIVGSVGDVFHAHAAEILGRDRASVGSFLASTAARLLLLGSVVYVPVAIIAPLTAGWVLGREWADAGTMVVLLTPLCIAQTAVTPISRGLLLSGREERKLFADLICLVLPVGALLLSRGRPMMFAIAAFSATATVAYVIYYFVIAGALKARPASSPIAP